MPSNPWDFIQPSHLTEPYNPLTINMEEIVRRGFQLSPEDAKALVKEILEELADDAYKH